MLQSLQLGVDAEFDEVISLGEVTWSVACFVNLTL